MQQERARRRRRRSPPPHPPPPTLFKPWGAGLSGVVRGMCMLLIMPYLPHSSCTAKPRRACAARQGGQGPGSKPAARVQPPHGPAAAQRSRPKAQLQRSAAASKKLVQEACCAALQLGCRRGTCTAPYPPGSPGTPYHPAAPPPTQRPAGSRGRPHTARVRAAASARPRPSRADQQQQQQQQQCRRGRSGQARAGHAGSPGRGKAEGRTVSTRMRLGGAACMIGMPRGTMLVAVAWSEPPLAPCSTRREGRPPLGSATLNQG